MKYLYTTKEIKKMLENSGNKLYVKNEIKLCPKYNEETDIYDYDDKFLLSFRRIAIKTKDKKGQCVNVFFFAYDSNGYHLHIALRGHAVVHTNALKGIMKNLLTNK